MYNLQIRLRPEARRSIDSTTVTAMYQVVGSAFTNPIILLKVVNDSNEAVDVSFDGTSDHDYIPAHSFFLYDCNSNKYRSDGMQFGIGDGVYVKGTAGTGNIYVVTFYAGA